MLIVQTPRDLAAHQGVDLGETDWVEVTQQQIDDFAELTGDDHWIHVDQGRAIREAPGGKTIAHGLFLMALIPKLQRQLFRIEKRGAGLNYGYDKIRFTAPVPVGSRIRLHQKIVSSVRRGSAERVEILSTIDIYGHDRPAMVLNGILLVHDADQS